LSVLKHCASGQPAAILMVTSQSHERDKLAGLNNGADDYIVKPFLVTELVARIRAVLRRSRPEAGRESTTKLRAGPLCLDLIKHTVHLNANPSNSQKQSLTS